MSARKTTGIGAIVLLPIVIAILSLDARAHREAHARDASATAAVVRRLPSSDLALSGGARWLRTPSLEEPGAAFSDGPALPDPDPAGGAISPPRDAWTVEASIRAKR